MSVVFLSNARDCPGPRNSLARLAGLANPGNPVTSREQSRESEQLARPGKPADRVTRALEFFFCFHRTVNSLHAPCKRPESKAAMSPSRRGINAVSCAERANPDQRWGKRGFIPRRRPPVLLAFHWDPGRSFSRWAWQGLTKTGLWTILWSSRVGLQAT